MPSPQEDGQSIVIQFSSGGILKPSPDMQFPFGADISTIKQRLVDQIDNSVMFYDQILNIENIAKPEKWYHIGPGNVTAGMVKKSISSEGIEIINSLDSLNNI